MTKDSKKTFLTPNEAAELLLVSPVTIRQWAQKGELPARVTPGGHRRFDVDDLVSFAKSKGIDIKDTVQAQKAIKVLIVDDDIQILNLLGELISIKFEDSLIEKASNGFEAGHKLAEFRPHVVILDIMVPGINGVSVCKNIRSNPNMKSTKVIAVTGFYTKENVSAMLDAGANACLPKPIVFDELVEAMKIE